jgi:hypothetical protein
MRLFWYNGIDKETINKGGFMPCPLYHSLLLTISQVLNLKVAIYSIVESLFQI